MSGFAFSVACLRLVANESLFGVNAVPVDWPVLRQNLRVVDNRFYRWNTRNLLL